MTSSYFAFLLMSVPAILAAVAEENDPMRVGARDFWALVGAAMAAGIVIIMVRKADQSLENSIAVFVSTISVGVFGPWALFSGLVNAGQMTAETYNALPWQAWFGSAFVLGLAAWALVQTFYTFSASGSLVEFIKSKLSALLSSKKS